jgi:hypothetical protein
MEARRILLIRISVLLCVVITLIIVTGLSSRARTENAQLAKPGDHSSFGVTQAPVIEEHAQLVRVFVHGNDLYPGFVVVRPGRVLLVAENETQTDISLVLEKRNPGQAPELLSRLPARQRDKRSRQQLTLGAGEYVFYPESNPVLRGRLIVDPNPR